MKRGFTLVELSIVLVIIGLLIGGILVAQSMISTARNTRLMSEIGQYQIAIRQFNTVFGYLPGDRPVGLTPGLQGPFGGRQGDGHWAIDGHGWLETMEGYNLWPELSTAGMVKDKYVHTAMYNGWSDDVVPASGWLGKAIPKLSNGSTLIGTSGNYGSSAWNLTYSTCQTGNFLMMGSNSEFHDSHTSAGGVHYMDAGIDPVDGKHIDTKLDDGVAYTGRVLAERGMDGTDICKVNNNGYGHIEYVDDYLLTGGRVKPQDGCRLYICMDDY